LRIISSASDIFDPTTKDTPELFSMKHVQYDNAIHNLEKQVWEDVKQNITSYISKQISGIKKLKTEIR